jgi:GH25 family lysozyme M1 (1,4-beta-N-acetylmuramidase)
MTGLTRLADISEHQDFFNARAYISGGYSCIIIRAHSGYRTDNKWPVRRDYVRGHPFTAVGYYQYVASDRDAATQARELVSAVGSLRDNEFLIADIEEGSSNQENRANQWFGVADQAQGFPATLYSGEYFCKRWLGGWDHWSGRPRWIAAYSNMEPADPHELWQNSDSAHFPGLPRSVDGNVFHGSDKDFLSTFRHGAHVDPPPPPMPAMAVLGSQVTAQNKDGRVEQFVETADGRVHHCYQSSPGGSWTAWYPLGKP